MSAVGRHLQRGALCYVRQWVLYDVSASGSSRWEQRATMQVLVWQAVLYLHIVLRCDVHFFAKLSVVQHVYGMQYNM